jgi:hypothetical protein
MREWTVRLETSRPGLITEDHADEVMEALKDYGPAVSYGPHTLSATFCVTSDSAKRAVQRGIDLFSSALKKAGIGKGVGVVGVDIQTLDDLTRSVRQSNFPELLGVAELAAVLKVSRQRASELARLSDFPKPIVHLKAGPVWKKATVMRHAQYWSRRPGRPRGTTFGE